MKSYQARTPFTNIPANPLMLWSDLIFKAGEMMTASAQVIGHRTALIATAGPAPSHRDQLEFTLMGQEKIEAASESAHAVAIRMMALHQELATLIIRQMLHNTASLLSVASSSSLRQSGRRQNKLARDTIVNSAQAVSQLNASLANIAETGLTPIHACATANAERLSKL